MWVLIVLLIFLIIYPYCIYPVILYILPKKTGQQQRQQDEAISVSLYIAAYNEERVIAAKLENSLRLDTCGIPFEIVVGSDGSTDKTNAIVQQYVNKYQSVRLLNFTDRAGKVNVLNQGVPLCKGSIILLSDANAMYNPDCLRNILPHFQDENVGCVAGEKRILRQDGMISDNEGMYWHLESVIRTLESNVKTVIGADGACYAIRKKLFVTLPTDTSVDDLLLSMKIVEQGYRIAYEPNAYSMEETGSTVQEEMNRKKRIAAGNFYNLPLLQRFLGHDLISIMFISHKVLRWFSPAVFILLTIAMSIQAIQSTMAGFLLLILMASYLLAIFKYCGIFKCFTDNKIGKLFSYFYLTVWSQFLGYLKYKQGRQKAIWDTVRK